MLNKIKEFWSNKIPELKDVFENVYFEIQNDNSGYYKNQNNAVYSLLSQTIVNYFDNALEQKDVTKLKTFFEAFEEFYKLFKSQFVSNENVPNDLISDILYVYIFEGIDDENRELAKSQMPKSILKEYDRWWNV